VNQYNAIGRYTFILREKFLVLMDLSESSEDDMTTKRLNENCKIDNHFFTYKLALNNSDHLFQGCFEFDSHVDLHGYKNDDDNLMDMCTSYKRQCTSHNR
jgi:hypothetical protein